MSNYRGAAYHTTERPLKATMNAVLDFLENNIHVSPVIEDDLSVTYASLRDINSLLLRVYVRIPSKNYEIEYDGIRFDITPIIDDPRTPPIVLVKGSHVVEGFFKKPYLSVWARLGSSFMADWAENAQKELDFFLQSALGPEKMQRAANEWETLSKAFDCSQDELFDVLVDLYRPPNNKWPLDCSPQGLKNINTFGDIELGICKKRILNSSGDYKDEPIGRITVGKIGPRISTLAVRTNNQELLEFFDELLKVVPNRYKTTKQETAPTDELEQTQSRGTLPGLLGRENIIRLAFASAKDEIEKYLWQRGLEGVLNFEPLQIQLPEGYGYNICHTSYGLLGQISIHPRERETRVRVTKSTIPSLDESLNTAMQQGHNFTQKPGDSIDWLFRQRERENETFYTDILKYLAEFTPAQIDLTAKLEKPKEPTAQTKPRMKEIKLPSKPGDAYKWVVLWDTLKPELEKDPTLALDYGQLLVFFGSTVSTVKSR